MVPADVRTRSRSVGEALEASMRTHAGSIALSGKRSRPTRRVSAVMVMVP